MEVVTTGMDTEQVAQVMDFAISLGEQVLVRGGELWRVENVLNDIFHTYDLQETGIFMLPHTLIISTKATGEETVIRQRNVGSIVVDMDELSRLNTMIRTVVAEKPEPEKLSKLLNDAIKGNAYSKPMTLLGMICALLSLNYFIGGGWKEAIFIALGISIVMGNELYLSDIPGTNKMAVNAVGSFVVGALDLIATRVGFISDPYLVMVVTAIGLVPGIPLINSCREMLCGRILCGGLLFMQAFMETLAVVCGFAIAISFLGG